MEEQAGKVSSTMFDSHRDLQHIGEPSAEEKSLKDMESDLSNLLQSIHEGAQILVESRDRAARLVGELCASLTAYTEWLGVTIELPPETVPQFYNAEKIVLTPNSHLVVIDRQGKVDSKALEEYPTEIMLIVVWNALSQLQSAMQRYAQRLGERIDILDRISSELRSLPISAEEAPGEET